MRLTDKLLILGVAAGLALAATLVARSGGAREPAQQPARIPVAADEDRAALEASVADTAPSERTREASEVAGDDIPDVGGARRREARKREAAILAEFLALRTEQGSEVFERKVRDVLASSAEPLVRKSAGLRALHSADTPGTDAVLVAAVQTQADASDGLSLSVPRCALKLLFERAPSGEEARRALARLAFVEDARVTVELRRRASLALKASIPGAPHDEIVRLLRLEATASELDAALKALEGDPNFGAAAPSAAPQGLARDD